MNTPHRPTEADFRSAVPFSRSGMRLLNGLGCSVSRSTQTTSFRTATWRSPLFETARHRWWSWSQFSKICPLREARGRCLVVRDCTSRRLDCASHLDVMSLAANIFAPFGAVPRINRPARRMAHDLLCAALLLSAVGLPAARARGATGHRRAWHTIPRFVPRPVARRRLRVLINGRTGLFEQPAHSPRTNPADSKSRLWFIYVNSGP